MAISDLPFGQVWAVDFEFTAPPGDRPTPICCVAHELKSGQVVRLFGDELRARATAPYDVSKNSLVVAYYASAEVGCHLALGWPVPERVVDLYAEFRCLTNGLDLPCGSRSLLGALATFGLPAIEAAEKQAMRDLAMRGEPYTPDERTALVDYCATDVVGTAKLLEAMLPRIDLPRALLRGRYMVASARIEHRGVPVDTEAHRRLRENWDAIKTALVERIDRDFGAFEGTSFRADRWERYLIEHGIAWPRLPSGRLQLDDDAFRDMARAHPRLEPMRELRHALSDLRLNALEVGRDGRNRVLLSAFGARTSRNTPSNTKFIFGPAVWLRGLIKPELGHAIAYVDWSQQEFGIAAALSRDPAMITAYTSGDPYLAFGKQAGRIPPDGTKQTHASDRELFKACALAVQYGMEAESLAMRLGTPTVAAHDLLRLHRTTYRKFWSWVDGAVDFAVLHGALHTVFGWTIHRGTNANPRSLRNFLMQANGAEMLRLACCYATEAGIGLCAPVHDALLIEASSDQIDVAIATTLGAMRQASVDVLDGFALRCDVKVFAYPERYEDARGRGMWRTVWDLIGEPTTSATAPTIFSPATGVTALNPPIGGPVDESEPAQQRAGDVPTGETNLLTSGHPVPLI